MRQYAHLLQRARAEVALADYLPFGSHLAPDVVRLRHNGELLASWRIAGIAFETADPQHIADRKQALHNFWNALPGGQVAIWAHKIRRAVHLQADGLPAQPFARAFTTAYNRSLDSGEAAGRRQMVTELYLSLIYRPPQWALAQRWRSTPITALHTRQQEHLAAMVELGQRLSSSLRDYGPERLGVIERDGKRIDEQAALYSFLLNGVWEDLPYCPGRLAEFLPSARLHCGDRNGMLELWHPQASRFAGMLEIQAYPRYSEPGMNNAILYGDYEYIETQSFSMQNKRDALAALDRQHGHLLAAEDPSTDEIDEIQQAIAQVNSGDIRMGEYHYSLAVFGDTPAQVVQQMAAARNALQDGPGFQVTVQDTIPECAWLAQLPGNWRMRPRQAAISSKNFTSLAPLHNFFQGKRYGNPWGPALAMLLHPSGQPVFFNHHVSPPEQDSTDDKKPGNTTVIGPTGAGKTALVNGLMLLAMKYPGLRGVFFDKDRGAEIVIRRLGGHYANLRRGEPTGMNPLQLPATETNLAFAEHWLRLLVGPAAAEQRASEEEDLSRAVRTVMSEAMPIALRRLAAIWQNLPVHPGGNSLRDRLRKWTAGYPLGWAFDNPTHLHHQDERQVPIYGYDYTEPLDDDDVRTPMVSLLLHLTGNLIDGAPFIYWMEEFWKALDSEHLADFAYNKQKTIRKQNGLGVFLTQSPSDVLRHKISKTIVEQSATKIFLPNPAADHDDYVEGFKLSEQEFQLVRNMGEDSRLFLLKQGHQSGILRFDLSSLPDMLNILSGSLDNVQLLDEIRAQVGDDPDQWEPLLHQRIAERRRLIAEWHRSPSKNS